MKTDTGGIEDLTIEKVSKTPRGRLEETKRGRKVGPFKKFRVGCVGPEGSGVPREGRRRIDV